LQTDESGLCLEELGSRLATTSGTLSENPLAGLAAEASIRYTAAAMVLAELLLLAALIVICCAAAVLLRRSGLLWFAVAGLVLVSVVAAFAFSFPEVVYYQSGRLAAAGVYTHPYVPATILGLFGVAVFEGAFVPRWLYLPPFCVVVFATFHSRSWIA
jgi:hypothetical protein